jgi:hypothetical protein
MFSKRWWLSSFEDDEELGSELLLPSIFDEDVCE